MTLTRHTLFNRAAPCLIVGLLVAIMLPASGCQSSQKLPGAGQVPGTGGQPDAQPADGDRTQEASKKPKLEVRTLSVQSKEARQALEKNFEGILQRKPLGFDADDLWDYASAATHADAVVTDAIDSVRQMTTREVVILGVPFVIVALFFVAYAAVRRPVRRLSHRWQARIHVDSSEWVTRLLRGLVMVGARCATVLALIGVSYVPVRAVFHQAQWAVILTDLLWLLLAYRAATATSVAVFSGRIIDLDDEDAATIERFAILGIRLAVGYSACLYVMSQLGAPDEIRALTEFGFRLLFLVLPVYALTIRDSLTALLPEDIDSALYRFYRRVLTQNFRPLMAVVGFLLAFRAAGFERASSFILTRGAALMVVTGLAFIVGSKLRQYLRRRLSTVSEEAEEAGPLDTDRDKLIRRIEQLLGAGTVLAVTLLFLELTALFEPALIILRTPFLAIGGARISFLHIINLGLIVFGAVLVTRIVRTLLNTQVYPYFEVDVGVAYAINTITNYLLIVIAFFVALNALGVDLTAITVVLASLGVGIGFGLQALVENLISGFIILFGRSVQKGDFITVNDTYGQVDAVGARSVVVKTPDNYELLIPSKDIVSAQVINWTYEDNTVRTRLPVGVSYEEDPQDVREVLLEITEEHPMILTEPPPHVRLKGFGDSSVNFELFFYFDCRKWTERRVLGEVNFAVWDALKDAGITIPFPQRDVHFKSLDNSDEFQKGFGHSERSDESTSPPPPEAEPSGRDFDGEESNDRDSDSISEDEQPAARDRDQDRQTDSDDD